MAELAILPAIFWGIIVGLYELFAIHADESFAGARWLTHGVQAAVFSFVFIFVVMNVPWALSQIPQLESIPAASYANYLPFRIVIGLIAMVKIQAASALVRGGRLAARGIGEHFIHTAIAGLLIIFSPEIMSFLWPPIANILPFG